MFSSSKTSCHDWCYLLDIDFTFTEANIYESAVSTLPQCLYHFYEQK